MSESRNIVITVANAARKIAETTGHPITGHQLSDHFYSGRLSEAFGPLVAGRRIIRESALPKIVAALRKRGLISV